MVVKTKSLGTRPTTYLSFLSRGIGLGHIFNRIACIVAQRPTLPHHEAKAGPHREKFPKSPYIVHYPRRLNFRMETEIVIRLLQSSRIPAVLAGRYNPKAPKLILVPAKSPIGLTLHILLAGFVEHQASSAWPVLHGSTIPQSANRSFGRKDPLKRTQI